MSASDDLNELDKRILKLRTMSANIDIYADYVEAGGHRRFQDWLTRRLTEDDFIGWPARQAGHIAERSYRPIGETL